jgi:hypothetical protein
MFRDFLSFLRALWAEWKTLLTGGTIVAALSIWNLSTSRTIPQKVSWIVLGLTLVIAVFFSWRKEWIAGDRGFIEISPNELARTYRDHTYAQATVRVSPYIGKHLRVSGSILNVHKRWPSVYISLKESEDVTINFWLPIWRAKVFMILNLKTPVTVSGRIEEIEAFNVLLTNVVLLKIKEIPKPPTNP